MSQSRPPVLDPYELLGVTPAAKPDEILAAYTRAVRARPRDAAAIHQAQEDLRQPYKRLAVDMLLALPGANDALVEALVDEYGDAAPLGDDNPVPTLAIAPPATVDASPVKLVFRVDLDDEPIITPELDP